ncbi:MAG: hypothetical protein RLN79_14800 [Cytophagales bacterium]
MNIESSFDSQNNLVITRAEGKVETATNLAASKKAIEIARKNNCHRFIFDIRNNPEGQTLLQAFSDMESMKKTLGFQFDDIIAVIYNPSIYSKERAAFVETIVENRANPRFKMFTNKDNALNWLNTY